MNSYGERIEESEEGSTVTGGVPGREDGDVHSGGAPGEWREVTDSGCALQVRPVRLAGG